MAKDERIFIDGGFNLSYGEMLYGKFGIKNKAMYCVNICFNLKVYEKCGLNIKLWK